MLVFDDDAPIFRLHWVHRVLDRPVDGFNCLIEFLDFIGIGVLLDFLSSLCPPFILYLPELPLSLATQLFPVIVESCRGWIAQLSCISLVLGLRQISDLLTVIIKQVLVLSVGESYSLS